MNAALCRCMTLLLFTGIYWNGTAQPEGFQNAIWGMSESEVQKAVSAQSWQQQTAAQEFPAEAQVTVYAASMTIAGYPAQTRFYFFQSRFFQATAHFDFSNLQNFDFNYNVYRSVDQYYTAIRGQTIVFINDIYELLRKKYGKKRPIFKGLDPPSMFVKTDRLLNQERWNFRYAPYEFYRRMIASGYARWDFPKTRVTFSLNMSAPDKRFDYQLSCSSIAIAAQVDSTLSSTRMRDL
jgi:hypothetical protein